MGGLCIAQSVGRLGLDDSCIDFNELTFVAKAGNTQQGSWRNILREPCSDGGPSAFELDSISDDVHHELPDVRDREAMHRQE